MILTFRQVAYIVITNHLSSITNLQLGHCSYDIILCKTLTTSYYFVQVLYVLYNWVCTSPEGVFLTMAVAVELQRVAF